MANNNFFITALFFFLTLPLSAQPAITGVSSWTSGSKINFSLNLAEAESMSEISVAIKSRNGSSAMSVNPDSPQFVFENTEPVKKGLSYTFTFTPILKDGTTATAKTLTRAFMPEDLKTGLPVMEIITGGCLWPEYRAVHSPAGAFSIADNEYVKNCAIRFCDGQGAVLYDSSKVAGDAVKIRGNTSVLKPKKPYKIKLRGKADLLAGIVSDGKDHSGCKWILLAKGGSLAEAIGFATSEYLGMDFTPAYAYIDLVVNGDWQGTYILCEQVERSRNRVQVADDGFLLENDFYFWNEPASFRTQLHKGCNFGWTFKYPDAERVDAESIACIKEYIEDFENSLAADDESYKDYIDEDTFARWLLVHDFLCMADGAGGNMYCTKYDRSGSSKLRMTAPWDFDSPLGRKESFSSIHSSGFFYFPQLLGKKSFQDTYRKIFEEKKDGFADFVVAKLSALDSQSINNSRTHDEARWKEARSAVSRQIRNFREFMEAHIAWMEGSILEM